MKKLLIIIIKGECEYWSTAGISWTWGAGSTQTSRTTTTYIYACEKR